MDERVEFNSESEQEDALFISRIDKYMRFSLIKYLKKMRLAYTDAQASRILVGISIVLFLIALGVFLYFVFDVGKPLSSHYYIPEKFRGSFPEKVQQQSLTP